MIHAWITGRRDRGRGRFSDRREAGRRLAPLLQEHAGRDDVVVLALPRGGVPVAWEIATALRVPLDVFAVRKLGVPGHEELAMGAIGTGGSEVIDSVLVNQLRISRDALLTVVERERSELRRQQALYRGERPLPDLAGMTVLLVDDGIATGASMSAAIEALRQRQPRRIVVAVPVAPEETCRRLRRQADEVVCCRMPDDFGGVGAWYENFDQVSDDEVRRLLRR